MELGNTITFELKQEHVGKSSPGTSSDCMVAVALKEHLGDDYDASVLYDDILIYSKNTRYKFYTSDALKKNIENFDGGFLDKIIPGSYTITKGK